jgi:hypothetical protein
MTVFSELAPQDLHAHVRYVATKLPRNARVELSLNDGAVVIPIVKRAARHKNNVIRLVIRSGSVGRAALDRIVESLNAESHQLWFRKSAKLKLVSQCAPYWPVSDPALPLHVVAVLKLVCRETGHEWPPHLALHYPIYEVDETLPGRLRQDPFWRAGRAVGRAIGRLVKGSQRAF